MVRRRRRRTWGEGSVYQRKDGQWVSSISVTIAGGKRVRQTVYSRNEQEARTKLREIQTERAEVGVSTSKQTVAEFSKGWVDGLEKSAATIDSINRSLRLYVNPYLGDLPIRKLKPAKVQWWLDKMKGDEVGGRTRQVAMSTLRSMCRKAVTLGVLRINPTSDLERPKAEPEEIIPFTSDEVVRILQASLTHRLRAVYLLAFLVGMRQEEIFALQWEDINWEAKTATIRRAMSEVAGKVTVKEVKTKKSRRVVPLHDKVIEALGERQAQTMREGTAGQPWVFLSTRGTLIRRSNFGNRQWAPLLEKANVTPRRGLHHARHTTATQLLRDGVPVHIVSGLLGHAKTSTTTDIYAHFMPEDLIPTADAIARTIGSKLATDLDGKAKAGA